ncbi:hypothetical protein HAZT_HAZT008442 [Hyalella azteca]|uniref:Saccharopine dehydrogenase-like C-terminal domain-containing protein n=1 Tax=Hyalella azteca TaxID=294128 RepID=A0A6A0H096_HYAAZ|nr:hypothetical protein HAZT_HAZT008442 [Hyalella azteca]
MPQVSRGGGKVESFTSYCGGLPAPEFSDNPLRYKFSWSPRGVLLNALADAKYMMNNKGHFESKCSLREQIVDIPTGGALLADHKPLDFIPGLSLEGFPNRDSTVYREKYGITDAHTVLRGTLRYRGYADFLSGLVQLRLLEEKPHPSLHPGGPDVTWRVNGRDDIVAGMEQLGLLMDEIVTKHDTPLDTLSSYLAKKLAFEPGERDLVVLRHDIGIVWPSGTREKRGINLICYGDAHGYSAMAKTVGYPCAIATQMVLSGEIQKRGMVLPFTAEIFKPMLSRLAKEGIKATETIQFSS